MTKNKVFSALLALALLVGLVPAIAQTLSPVAGPPDYEVTTVILPDTLSVYQDQPLRLTATTTYDSNKHENQWLHFVSDEWLGVDLYDTAVETEIELEGESAAFEGARQKAFVSTAQVLLGAEPGDYDVVVRYEITLQHDNSGQRTYYTLAETAVITVTVMEGLTPVDPTDEEEPEEVTEGAALNHGQTVSAWAHWKQTKGNKNFLPGGPGVYRSLVWYKAQVEYRTFYSRQEVWDFLDSIYEPAPRNLRQPNPNKGPGNNNGNNGNNGNGNKGK